MNTATEVMNTDDPDKRIPGKQSNSLGWQSRPRAQDMGDEKRVSLGFIMIQEAGYIAFSRNLRTVVDQDHAVKSVWKEVFYTRSSGPFSRLYTRLRFLPYHPFGYLQEAGGVYRALRSGGCDALFITSLMGSHFSQAFRRIPTIYCTDATPVQLENMPGYGIRGGSPLSARLRHQRHRRFFHSTRLVMTWSEWARQSFIQDYGLPKDRVIVNPPGIDLRYWRPAPPFESGRSGPVRLLFVGADFQRKNGPALLDWFSRQPAGTCELNVVTREALTPREGVKVHIGLRPNTPELLHLYQNSDIFVLPSRGECFGIATVEAMATGLPVVQTNVGGVADIVRDGINGHIIPPDDAGALDAALQSLVRDPAGRRRMARAGRELAEQKFDVDRNCGLILQHMKEFGNEFSGANPMNA